MPVARPSDRDRERPLNPRFMEPLPKIAFGVTKAETEREREAIGAGKQEGSRRVIRELRR